MPLTTKSPVELEADLRRRGLIDHTRATRLPGADDRVEPVKSCREHVQALSATPPAAPGRKREEEDFQKAVIDMAHLFGWSIAHFRKVRIQRSNGKTYWETPVAADGKGFLDLILVRDRLLIWELKTEEGRLTPDQKTWINRWRKAGFEPAVVRPSMWEWVEKELSR